MGKKKPWYEASGMILHMERPHTIHTTASPSFDVNQHFLISTLKIKILRTNFERKKGSAIVQ